MSEEKEKIILLQEELNKTKEMLNLYRHDELTGLKMRRDFTTKFNEYFHSGLNFNLTIVDVNGLKIMNTDLGFSAGDSLIKSVSSRLVRTCSGIVYRIGGMNLKF